MELGISRRGLKKRVLHCMRLLLLGVNRKPSPPLDVEILAVSCSHVRIRWKAASVQDNSPFPVHKYTVQRAGEVSSGTDSYSSIFNTGSNSKPTVVSAPPPRWVTVCAGVDMDCHDTIPASQLNIPGNKLQYRVTAWNAIGRSERVTVSLDLARMASEHTCGFLLSSAHVAKYLGYVLANKLWSLAALILVFGGVAVFVIIVYTSGIEYDVF